MAEQFKPGDRVRGMWDLATVVAVLDASHVLVQFDPIDATGTQTGAMYHQPVRRHVGTLTKVPQDTPMAEENAFSKAARKANA